MDYPNYTLNELVQMFKDAKGLGVSANTITVFRSSLRRCEKVLGTLIQHTSYSFIIEPNLFLKLLINEGYSLNTLYASISANCKICGLLNITGKVLDKNLKVLTQLKHERDNYQLNQMKNVKEQKNWINYKDMINTLDNELDHYLDDEDISVIEYRNFLLLNIMTRELPVRLGNFENMQIKTNIRMSDIYDLPKENYLIINKNSYIFIFNKYKTAKQYGTQINIIEDDTLDHLLQTYFERYHGINEKYFLTTKHNKPLDSQQIGIALKDISTKLFDKNLSVDLIRHIYITNFLSKDPPITEKIKLANIMNHSLIQQEFYKKI